MVAVSVDPKELYEHLEVLLLATEGANAEASFDYVVDALNELAWGTDHHTEVGATVRRWQRTYRPTDAVQAADSVRGLL